MDQTPDPISVAEELRVNYGELTTGELMKERSVIINRRYDEDGSILPLSDYDLLMLDAINGILEERATERGI